MRKLVKGIAAMGAAVMMMSTMAISAYAFDATEYGRTTGGKTSSIYISCFVTGAHTNNVVSGMAWTKTSSNNSNVYNPNCNYSGFTSSSVSVGGVGCGTASSETGAAIKNFSLPGCTTSKVVKSTHIYDDSNHGYFSTILSTDS